MESFFGLIVDDCWMIYTFLNLFHIKKDAADEKPAAFSYNRITDHCSRQNHDDCPSNNSDPPQASHQD
jgi:hypothetical protein